MKNTAPAAQIFSTSAKSRSRLVLFCALIALLVLIGIPVLHQHQGSEAGADCAACLVQHAKANIGAAPAVVTLARQISLPVFQFSEHFAAPSRDFWIDTLSRGPPTV